MLVLFASSIGVGAQPEQKVHREGFEPAGDEIFDLLTEFYAYDVELPLEARVVESWSEESSRYEKIVFTTSTGERVPMLLALPGADAGVEGESALLVVLEFAVEARDWLLDRLANPARAPFRSPPRASLRVQPRALTPTSTLRPLRTARAA